MAQSTVSPSGSRSAALGLVGFFLLLSGPGGPFVQASSPVDETPAKCQLKGMWVNELGSQMDISDVEDGGSFSGTYLTAVGATSTPIKRSPLRGFQKSPANWGQPTFGFTVHWSFAESTTVFTGQCFLDIDGQETLVTTWLLRSKAENHRDDWQATRVGRDIFHRKRWVTSEAP